MKNKLLSLVATCFVMLFVATLPAGAQAPSGEYQETLKKIMVLSGSRTSMDNILPQFLSAIKRFSPQTDEAALNAFSSKWGGKIEEMIIEAYTPIYQRYLTLDDLKKVVAFYESPAGQQLAKTVPAILTETMPMMQKLSGEMARDMTQLNTSKITVSCQPAREKKNNPDKAMFDTAYTLPVDSIQVADMIYKPGMSTTPLLYTIERRKNDTKVTFLQPIYFDSQWLHYSRGYKIVDRSSGDEYHVRGYDGGAPFDRLLIVKGFNNKYIYVSLLFPKLKKSVKRIDLLELPHAKDITPSNDDGKAKSYYNVKLEKYLKSPKKSKKVYY